MTQVQRIARIDARGWYARNRSSQPNEQVVKNHYSMSRDKGYLGTVSVAPRGRVWTEYRDEFKAEIERRQQQEVRHVQKRAAESSGL